MKWTDRRRRFRQLLADERCFRPASVYDPVSARLAEIVGFEMMMMAGSTASLAVLGLPDLVLLTLTEFAEQTHRICRATDRPLLVDADHGYGNALNVRRTVEELETAGVAALTIEDTALPRPYGTSRPTLITLEEGIGKMKAAVGARVDPELVIVGRTSATAITGLEDGIARLSAYEKTGVDALFVAGVNDPAELEAIAARTTLPLMLGGSTIDVSALPDSTRKRFRVWLYGHQTMAAAIAALHATMQSLRKGEKVGEDAATRALIAELSRAEGFAELSRPLLGG